MPALRRGDVIVFLALWMRKRGIPHNVGDAARHDELGTVANQLQRGGEVTHLQSGESVVDDTGVVHLHVTCYPEGDKESTVHHHQ